MKIVFSLVFKIWMLTLTLFLAGCNASKMEAHRANSIQHWNEMIVLYQQRSDLITYMAELMSEQYDQDSGVLSVVNESNAKFILSQRQPNLMTDASALLAFEQADAKLTLDLTNMLLILKNPVFQSNRELMDLKQDFSVIQEKIVSARQSYVDSVKVHNQTLNSFPYNLIGFMLDYTELPLLKMDRDVSAVLTFQFNGLFAAL